MNYVTRKASELHFVEFEKKWDKLDYAISAPENDPESKFYFLAKYLHRLQEEGRKNNKSYNETSKAIDALLIRYNHDQIDIDKSMMVFGLLLCSGISQIGDYKNTNLSSMHNWDTPDFYSPDDDLATHSKIFDDSIFRKKIDQIDNFFDIYDCLDFWEMISNAFISFPELLRSEKIENINMQNRKDAELNFARRLIINFEKLFKKIKKEGEEDVLFENLDYIFSSFIERNHVNSKYVEDRNTEYFEGMENEGLLSHAHILLADYDDKILGPKIKDLRKKLNDLGEFADVCDSNSEMLEVLKKREDFLKTVPEVFLRYMTFFYTQENIQKLKKLINKTNLDDKDFDSLRSLLAEEKHWHLNFQQFYLPDKRVESLVRRKAWDKSANIDFVPEQIKLPKKNLKAHNELKILIYDLIDVIEQNPFIAIELIMQCHNKAAKENSGIDKSLFWSQIRSLISTKLQSIIDGRLDSIKSSMGRVLIYLHGYYPYRYKGSDSEFQYCLEIHQDLRVLIEYFQDLLKQLVNADIKNFDYDEGEYKNDSKNDGCESGSKEPILMNSKLLIWEIINNFKAIETHIISTNSIWYSQEELTYEQIYLLSGKIEKKRILSSDNVNDYISFKLPKKNYLKDKYNFLRVETNKGHLIAKDKKTKNKNGQVGNRFKMKHVLSWLKERRGIDVYMLKPDYSLDRDLNINDFFTFFFREL